MWISSEALLVLHRFSHSRSPVALREDSNAGRGFAPRGEAPPPAADPLPSGNGIGDRRLPRWPLNACRPALVRPLLGVALVVALASSLLVAPAAHAASGPPDIVRLLDSLPVKPETNRGCSCERFDDGSCRWAAVVLGPAAHLAAYPSSGALFTDFDGQRPTYRRWRKECATMRKATGYTEAGTHDLRHYTASALIAGGASGRQGQVFLGHSSAAITLRVYAHLWPGDDDRTRDVMDARLAEVAQAAGESTQDRPDAPTHVLMGASG